MPTQCAWCGRHLGDDPDSLTPVTASAPRARNAVSPNPPRSWRARNPMASLKGDRLLWTVVVVLLALWVLGSVNAVGGRINLLLVVAIIVIAVRLLQGRRVL